MHRFIITLSGLLVSLTLSFLLSAQGVPEDRYTTLKPAQPTQTGDKIEVVEIFWYGCPHCYSFEPYLDDWIKTKPDDVELIRLPGVLNQAWIPHAKAYYTALKLDMVDRIHRPLFDAVHKQRQSLSSEADLRRFFVSQGVPAEDFTRIYNSAETDTKIRQAYFLARDYRLTGVPAIVVNGKYVTTPTQAGSYEGLLEVMTALIETERKGRD